MDKADKRNKIAELKQWADTDVKKLLYDEWCANIGSLVVKGNLEDARKLSDSTLLVLKFTEEYLDESLDISVLSAKLASSVLSSNPSSSNPASITGDRADRSNEQERKTRQERVRKPVVTSSNAIPVRERKPYSPEPSQNQYTNPAEVHHNMLICGRWPRGKDSPNVRMMRFLDETPNDIQKAWHITREFNDQMKSIEDELEYVSYVTFKDLLAPNEIVICPGKDGRSESLTEWTIVTMLERLAQH